MQKLPLIVLVFLTGCGGSASFPTPDPVTRTSQLARVTAAVPFAGGIALKGSSLYLLSRGRVSDAGGTDTRVIDFAGTLWTADPRTFSPLDAPVSEAVRKNARALPGPTDPPFRLLSRALPNALDDTRTDQPYRILRYDAATSSFYFCAYSAIDTPIGLSAPDDSRGHLRKNNSDGILRFDTRDNSWHLLYRNPRAALTPPPGGWHEGDVTSAEDRFVSGPDNCVVVGNWLYVVARESCTISRFDLTAIRNSTEGEATRVETVAGRKFKFNGDTVECLGPSALAYRDGWLYVGFRTTSQIVRLRESDLEHHPAKAVADLPPVDAELIATFDPQPPDGAPDTDLTDMVFGPTNPGEVKLGQAGTADLYVLSAKPARVYRFTPDPKHAFDGRMGKSTAWADLARITGNPQMRAEALAVNEFGQVFVASADLAPAGKSAGRKSAPASAPSGTSPDGLAGVVYRISP